MRQRDRDILDRRDFIRQSACASLGLTGLASSIANLRLMTAAMAQGSGGGGYKAIVNVFQFGGNDSNNMLIPTDGELRTDYEANRGILTLPVDQLQAINPSNDTRGFGLHPNCSGMASMFNSGKLGFVANVGSLSYPVPSRQDYLDRNVPLPPQLFSHSDQQVQWQSSIPDKSFTTGWGGRVADLLNDSYNANGKVSMSISLNGINSFQTGTGGGVVQYAVGPTGAQSLAGYGNAYSAALNPDGSYRTTWNGHRLKAFDTVMNYAHANLMERAYNDVMKRSREAEEVVGLAVSNAEASDVDFDAIFANAQTRLGDRLKMIAKLISGRGDLENNRQVFFCAAGGYDTHQDQLSSHGNLMTEFDNALTAFQNALEALGVSDDVVTFSSSDFTRTFTPNGSDPATAGSDHGWGGHAVVMGGPVDGGKLYGSYPQLKVNAGDDVNGNRGRWIPSTAVDQYFAVIADWFGVDASSMDAIFPNLGRFEDPFGASANLQFITTS